MNTCLLTFLLSYSLNNTMPCSTNCLFVLVHLTTLDKIDLMYIAPLAPVLF